MSLLSLEAWRKIVGYHPWHFWQLSDTDKLRVTSACNDVVFEYPWQSADGVGRDDVRQAIENAEALLAQHLHFWPAPKYIETTLQYPVYHNRNVKRLAPGDEYARWLNVQLPDGGYVQALGVEAKTHLGDAVVTLSDEDGDGVSETFTTAAVATTETDTDNIAVYFITADRLDDDLDRWRIEPVQVTISGGSVIIKGKAWQIVKPIQYEGVDEDSLDPATAGVLAASLAIYTRKTNPDGATASTSQAKLIWETEPYPAWAVCCGSDTAFDDELDPAALATATARAGIRDARTGLVYFGRATYNATVGQWQAVDWGLCRPPDRVTLRYLAGYACTRGEMDKRFQVAVARLAAAELARPICACDRANRELYRWQYDLAQSSGNDDEAYGFSPEADLNNPFGTRRGHVHAWKFVQSHRLSTGMSF